MLKTHGGNIAGDMETIPLVQQFLYLRQFQEQIQSLIQRFNRIDEF